MDLNRKYSDHQREIHRAKSAPDDMARSRHLGRAADIAGQIASHQTKLGAAAACAWSAAHRAGNARLAGRTT